jgi:tRNA G18 (ribose-2'-O)-methylase SpoU
MVTPTAFETIAADLGGRGDLPVFVVPQAVMNAVAGFNIHRGCLAIGERPAPVAWDALAGGCPPGGQCLVALEHVGNADNIGAMFRAAAAFEASGVLLDGRCADPLYRKAIRTSMGAALHVPFATDVPWAAALAGLRRDGWALVGLTPAAGSAPVREVCRQTRGGRVVLVLGHEGDGISGPTAAVCTHLARIPMTGDVDSLNVAMAAGVALYEWRQSVERG